MIDYHCHILPGMDDGAGSVEEALEIARLLAEAGFAEVYCTPHCIRGCYDNTPEGVQRAVAELQKEVDRVGIPLVLHPGMEYYLDEYFPQQLEYPQPLGDTNLLLVEASSQGNVDLIKENIFLAVRRGYTPLFAHPERYSFLSLKGAEKGLWGRAKRFLTQNSSAIDDLRNIGCLFQGNIGSFAGIYGAEIKKQAKRLFQAELYCRFGSDAHRPNSLAKMLERGLDGVRGPETTEGDSRSH